MRFLLLLLFAFYSIYTWSQCEINVSGSPSLEITCGESVTLSAFGSSTGQLILDEDFNTGGFGPGWSSTPGAVNFTNPCSPAGVDGTTHAWMDNNTSVPRALTSTPYDLTAATAGVTICFDMLFAEQGNSAPCEGPDEPDEGVFLQYSTDGGATWIDIHYFDPNGGNDPQLVNWNNWCFQIPPAAITANTMFQWYQEADSGADYDHWGIDNVQIFMNDITSEIVWLHDGYSYGLGSPGGDNPTPVTPTSTTTYTAQITTGTGSVCTADVTVVVIAPIFDVTVAAAPSTICSGDCATITGSAQIIQDPGGIETYENNEFALVASGSASVNINVQGINTSSITPGLIQNVTINGFSFSGSFFCTSFGGCDCNGTPIGFGSTCNITASGFTVTLTSPGGCTMILAPSGVATGNYSNTVFVPVGGTAFGPGFPSGGTWDPEEPFTNLNGCDPNGVWTLSFDAPGLGFGIGTLNGWSITFDDPPIYQPVCTSWSPATGLSNPTDINTDACPSASTNYTLTVSNCVPGCPTYDEVVAITVNPCGGCIPPNMNIVPLNACSPNTVDLNDAIGAGSDPATITFHNSQADAQSGANAIASIVGVSGSYWVRAEDPADPACFLEYEIIVTINDLSYAISIVDETCGTGDGQISLTANLGTGPYTYSINGGTTTQGTGSFNGLSAGSYDILITDNATGCTVDGIETVGNLGGPIIDNIIPTDPTCPGACDGEITVVVSGGAPPYSYQWFDALGAPVGTNNATITGLCAGDYSVEVSDAAGGTTQLFYDDFETGAAGWNLNVTVAPEGADANFFEVDDDEGGVAVGGCGIAGNGDATLHVTSVFFPGGGAAYDAGGLCGFLFCPETHRRSESPFVNTVGQSGLTLNFDYIAQGDAPDDQATVWYNDGGGWVQLGGALFSGTGVCAPQGIWTAYSAALPASCENIPNLQIAIRWDNNDDGVGTDPSVAINNIEIVTSGAATCTSTEFATLSDPLGADPTFTLTDFCAGSVNAATGIVTPGGTFAYNPNPADGSTINATTGEITNGVEGATYTVEYTTSGACPVSSTNTVTVNGFSYNALVTDENCGLADGEIDLSTVGGTGPFTYSIDNGATTQGSGTFTGISAGVYSILVTDNASGCTASGSESVANIGGPSIDNAVATNPTCPGACDGEITVTVSGGTLPYSYQWFDALGAPIGGNSATITGLCDGDYSVEVSDAGGGSTILNTNTGFEVGPGGNCDCPTGFNCNNDAGQVFDGSQPVYSAGDQGCVGGSTNYTNSLGAYNGSGYVYFYAGADNISSGPYAFVGGETVELCVYYAGPQGAGAPGQNTAASHFSFGVDGVQVGPDVLVPVNTGWTQFCFTVVMTAGNHTFEILSGNAAQYAMWFDDFTITNQAGGGGSCPVTSNFTLTDPLAQDPGFSLTDFCLGDANAATSIVTPGGVFDYNPNPADGSSVDPATGEILNGVPGTTYTIEYTLAGACTVSSTENVTVNGFTYTATITDEACGAGDGAIDLNTVGGGPAFDYSIDNGVTTQGTNTFTNLIAGAYTIVITDPATGCTASGIETISNSGGPQIDVLTVTNETCLGANDGTIDVSAVSGGSGTYTYSWDIIPDPGTAAISGLTPGSYTVTVTDVVLGCFTDSTITLNAGPNCCDLVISSLTGTNLNCFNVNDGTITITTTGGTAPIDYAIDNGVYSDNNATGIFTNLPAGIYTVTVSDATVVCTDVDAIELTVPTAVTTTITRDNILCFGQNTGSIEITALGGTAPYQYSIDNGITWLGTSTFTNLGAGNYQVIVEDANGCQSVMEAVLIIEPAELDININASNEVCYNACDGEVTWNGMGGTAPYVFVFDGVLTPLATISNLCAGDYNYSLADANGCSVSGVLTIAAAEQIQINALLVSNDGCTSACDGSIQVSSTQAVSYVLGGVSNATGLFTGLCSDSYSIILQDANGCTVSANAIVSTAEQPIANFNLLPEFLTTTESEMLVFNNSTGADVYEWQISGPNGYTYSTSNEEFNLELDGGAGGYYVCLIVSNTDGCSDTLCQAIEMREELLLFVPNTFTPNGDEFNNGLKAYAIGIDEYSFDMQIFNRWGEQVWESHDINVGWDGTYNGQVCQDGTYTWKIRVKDLYTDEHLDFVGHVNILK